MFARGTQLGGIFALAMALGGPKVRQEFYQMTSDLTKVSTKMEFAEWTIKSQYRMIELVKIDWKPVSVFPKEAYRFR
jgi:hypothetical protein